jgi:thiol:disulfide interchange protein DsbC
MLKRIVAVALALAGSQAALAADAATEARIRTAIQELVQGTQIEAITESRVPGFFEVTLGGQVVYVSSDGKYLLSGALWDVAAKKNLTDARYAEIRKGALDAVGKDKRIVYAAKEPKHVVSVFTDIDCGYCRRLHQQMADYNKAGITVEYLFFPRAGVGSDSFNKAVSVWCAADRNQALTQAKNGDTIENKTCTNPIGEEFELGRKIGISGTPAVITGDGTQIGGYLTPEQMVARLDQLKAEGKAKAN